MNEPSIELSLTEQLSSTGVLDDVAYRELDAEALAWSDVTILAWLNEERLESESLLQTMIRKLKKLYRLECNGY